MCNQPTPAAPLGVARQGLPTPLVVILCGVVAAMHIGKMPPAIPALQASLQVSLVQAGFLLSMAQLAGMLVGVLVGALTDGLGLRRSLLSGLVLLSVASGLGAWADHARALLALRALEGLGVLLVVLPAPSLLRRLLPPTELARHLGVWGAYMPTGTAAALLAGPWLMQWLGWQGLWLVLAGLTAAMAAWAARQVPADPPKTASTAASTAALTTASPATTSGHISPTPSPVPSPVQGTASQPAQSAFLGWLRRLRRTLGSLGPWLVALAFAMYSSQWLAVIGFLPSVYAQAGLGAAAAGGLTALVCAINITGNVAAGRLLHRGWSAPRLLAVGFVCMAVSTWLAFHPLTAPWPALRYAACLAFSAIGGLVPGTLFSMAVRVAPDEQCISTTVGWVQQCSSTGQFIGPPLVAWVAQRVGGWHLTWAVTGTASLLGLVLVALLSQRLGLWNAPVNKPRAMQ